MAYVIGILVAAAVLVGSAVVVLVDIARLEEILPPPVNPDKDKPADSATGGVSSVPPRPPDPIAPSLAPQLTHCPGSQPEP